MKAPFNVAALYLNGDQYRQAFAFCEELRNQIRNKFDRTKHVAVVKLDYVPCKLVQLYVMLEFENNSDLHVFFDLEQKTFTAKVNLPPHRLKYLEAD